MENGSYLLSRFCIRSGSTTGRVCIAEAALVFLDFSCAGRKTNANPYCVTDFVGSTDFLQQLNRSCFHIRYRNDGRRIVRLRRGEVISCDMCFAKSVCCLNADADCTNRVPKRPSPPSFPATNQRLSLVGKEEASTADKRRRLRRLVLLCTLLTRRRRHNNPPVCAMHTGGHFIQERTPESAQLRSSRLQPGTDLRRTRPRQYPG